MVCSNEQRNGVLKDSEQGHVTRIKEKKKKRAKGQTKKRVLI